MSDPEQNDDSQYDDSIDDFLSETVPDEEDEG